MSAPPPPPSALPPLSPLPPAVTLPPRAGITLTWRRVVVLLVGVALVAVVATVLTIGGLVAGLGYYAAQQEAAADERPPAYSAPSYSPPAPRERWSAPPAPAPRSNYIERLEEEGRRRDEERRLRDLEKRQSELERCQNARRGDLVLGCR